MRRVLTFGSLVLAAASASAQITFTGGEYTENFDSLAQTSTSVSRPTSATGATNVNGQNWTNGSTIPGWFASFENPASVNVPNPVPNGNWIGAGVIGQGGNTIPTFDTRFIRFDSGTNNGGSMYNYGLAAGTNRSLGSLNSGGGTSPLRNYYGLAVVNGGTLPANSFSLDYVGRQWRLGASTLGPDRLDFSYRIFSPGTFDASDLRDTGWTDLDAGDFTSPISTGGTSGALDGTLAANSRAISFTGTGFTWNPGDVLALRWNDFDKSGADDGLAVDNVRLRAAVPEPASMAVLGLGLAAMKRRRRR